MEPLDRLFPSLKDGEAYGKTIVYLLWAGLLAVLFILVVVGLFFVALTNSSF